MEEKMDDGTLRAFLQDIESHAREDVEAMARAVSDEHEEKTRDARRQAEREAEAFRQAELARIGQEERLAADARRAQDRERLLSCRAECAGDAMAALRERLAAFTASDEYRDRLYELMRRGLDALGTKHGPAVVYLRREDLALGDALRSRAENVFLTVREGDFQTGGVIVESEELGRRADMSFDTALRGVEGRFAEIFGMEIV